VNINAGNGYGPGGWRKKPTSHADESRFPRPIRTNQTVNLTLWNREVQITHRNEVAEFAS
jgi:hypothetical protein